MEWGFSAWTWRLGTGWPYLARVLLLVDDSQGVFRGLPPSLRQGPLHLGPLCADELVGLSLRVRHGFLQLRHCLPLHLIHSLFCKGRGGHSHVAWPDCTPGLLVLWAGLCTGGRGLCAGGRGL